MTLYVGTSGWSYPEWQPAFYPAGLRRSDFLRHYAGVFGACEINATAHRLQSVAAVTAWAEAARPGFRFVCKVHRGVTHGPGAPPADLARRYLASLRPLGGRLAAVLAQIPDTRTRDDDFLDELLGLLTPAARVVVETAHPSWDDPAVDALVARHGGTRCLNHPGGMPPAALPPGPVAYVRLRGERYHEDERAAWRRLLEHEAAHRDVYAMGRHKDLPPDDPHTGLGLARWLAAPATAPPDRGGG